MATFCEHLDGVITVVTACTPGTRVLSSPPNVYLALFERH